MSVKDEIVVLTVGKLQKPMRMRLVEQDGVSALVPVEDVEPDPAGGQRQGRIIANSGNRVIRETRRRMSTWTVFGKD